MKSTCIQLILSISFIVKQNFDNIVCHDESGTFYYQKDRNYWKDPEIPERTHKIDQEIGFGV